MEMQSVPARQYYRWLLGLLFLSLLLPHNASARASWKNERSQKISEAKHYLSVLENKAKEFGKLHKKLTGGASSGLSREQVNNVKSWVRKFGKEYNQAHDKMLDAEDRVHFLDRKLEGKNKDNYAYTNLSNERLAALSKIGTKYNQQRVELVIFLENEKDTANKQLSTNFGARNTGNSSWGDISKIMAAASGIPDPPAFKPAPAKRPQRAIASAAKKPRGPEKISASPAIRGAKKRQPSRAPANIGQKPRYSKQPPRSLPKKGDNLRTMRLDFNSPTQNLEIAPMSASRGGSEIASSLMSVGSPINSSVSGQSCSSLDKALLKSLNDGKTDFHLLLKGLGKVNQMAMHYETSDRDIDIRFGVFKHVLAGNSLDSKFNAKVRKILTAKEKVRLKNLKYHTRVHMMHLYDSAIRHNTKATYKAATGKKITKEWAQAFFSDQNTDLIKTEWVGGRACKKVKKTKQARGKCLLKMYVRHGKSIFCRPALRGLKQGAYVYTFDWDPTSKGWALAEMHVPRVWKKGSKYYSSYVPTLKAFYTRINSRKENLSTIESWIQKGVPTSDLLGFESFLENGPKRGLASDDFEAELDSPRRRARKDPLSSVADDYSIDESDLSDDGNDDYEEELTDDDLDF